MPRISSFVRMIDSSTTVPANKAAHKYMSRTLVRCECPMARSRCWRCFLSAENGESPARVRRTTASSRSAYGISMMMAGTSSGRISGKRLTVPPLYADGVVSVFGSRDARLEMGSYASSSPSSIDPVSPMKMRAGWKLCGRNPRQIPARMADAIAGSVWSSSPSRFVSV
jgi:hypothetical protein